MGRSKYFYHQRNTNVQQEHVVSKSFFPKANPTGIQRLTETPFFQIEENTPTTGIPDQATTDDHNLQSDLFKGDPTLEACYDGDQSSYLRHGSSGEPVMKLQQALMETGYPLPQYGPDGKFGNETGTAVSHFKVDKSLTPSDPVAGQKTIAKLDEIMEQKGKTNPSNNKTCSDSAVNQEKEPLPDIPIPTITRMNAPELLEIVKKRQPPGHVIPPNPPLGATMPVIENINPAKAKALPIPGSDCFQCVAEWEMVKPKVDIFIATGTFSDEKRFFVVQPDSISACPVGVSLKEVKKVILPEAEPFILDAELEHWSDFVFSYLFVVGRYLSNVRRLTPSRSHLKGKSEAECTQKVAQFIFETTTRLPVDPLANFGKILGSDLIDLYHPNTNKRDEKDHSAISKPPKEKPPVFPNIDTNINPFGCEAYFRKFDKNVVPGVPGLTSLQIIEDPDKNIPPFKSWHTL